MSRSVDESPRFVLDARRWTGGIGRFAVETTPFLPPHRRLESSGRPTRPIAPLDLAVALQRMGRSAGPFLSHGYIPPLASPTPAIVTIHDLMYLRGHSAFSRSRAAYLSAMRPLYRRCAAILTMSETARGEVRRWLGDDSRVIAVGGGVAAPFRPAADVEPDLSSALYVGSRLPNKNVDGLLRGFERSAHAASLAVTGAAEDWASHVEPRALRAKTVEHLGSLSESALINRYRRAGVLVMPSIEEGFGLPAIEAMACGTPVVYGRCAALCEVIGDAGIAVDPHDHRAIGQAIDDVLGDPERRAELVAEGRRRADVVYLGGRLRPHRRGDRARVLIKGWRAPSGVRLARARGR